MYVSINSTLLYKVRAPIFVRSPMLKIALVVFVLSFPIFDLCALIPDFVSMTPSATLVVTYVLVALLFFLTMMVFVSSLMVSFIDHLNQSSQSIYFSIVCLTLSSDKCCIDLETTL